MASAAHAFFLVSYIILMKILRAVWAISWIIAINLLFEDRANLALRDRTRLLLRLVSSNGV